MIQQRANFKIFRHTHRANWGQLKKFSSHAYHALGQL